MKLVPIQPDVKEEVRTHVQKLVSAIESGECVGYLAVAVGRDGVCRIFQCAPNVPLIQSIGAVTVLQNELLREM